MILDELLDARKLKNFSSEIFNANIINSDIGKDIIDGLSQGLNTPEATKALDGLIGKYATVAGELDVVQMAQDGLNDSTIRATIERQKLNGVVDFSILQSEEYRKAQNGATAAMERDTKATNLNTKAHKALNAVKQIGKQLLVSAAITGATMLLSKGIELLVKQFTKAQEAAKKFAEEVKEANEKLKELNKDLVSDSKSIKDLAKSYEELSDGVDKATGKNIKLSTEDYEEYIDVNNQIAVLLPHLVTYTDEYGNKIVDLTNNVSSLTGANLALADSYEEILMSEYRATKFKDTKDAWDKNVTAYGKDHNVDMKKVHDAHRLNTWLQNNGYDGTQTIGDFFDAKTKELENDRSYQAQQKRANMTGWKAQFKNNLGQTMQEIFDNAYAEFDNALKENWAENNMASTFISMLNFDSDSAYRELNTSTQKMIQGFINGFTLDSATINNLGTSDEIYKWMKKTFIEPLAELSDDEKQRVESYLSQLYNTDSLTTTTYNSIKKGLSDVLDKINEDNPDFDIQFYTDLFSSVDELEKTFTNDIFGLARNEWAEVYDYTKDLTLQQKQLWLEATKGLTTATEKIKAFELAMISISKSKSFHEIYKDISSWVNPLVKAKIELEENGFLSIETVDKLIEAGYDIESSLEPATEGYKLQKQVLQDLIDAKMEVYRLDEENARNAAIAVAKANDIEIASNDETTESIIDKFKSRIADVEAIMEQIKANGKLIDQETQNKINSYTNQMSELQSKLTGGRNVYEDARINAEIERLWKLRSQLISQSGDADTSIYETEITELKKVKDALEDSLKARKNAEKILNEIGDGSNSGSDLKKQAVSDIEALRDLIYDYLREQKELAIEAIEEELDAYNKVLDARREALELTKEQNEYEKDLAEKNKSVADIQAELNALQYDDSAAGIKRKLELQEKLADATDDLNEFVADHEYDMAMENLDKQQEAAEKDAESRIKILQDELDDEAALMAKALQMALDSNEKLYNDLVKWNQEHGDGITKNITEKWNEAQTALTNYKKELTFDTLVNGDKAPNFDNSTAVGIAGSPTTSGSSGGTVNTGSSATDDNKNDSSDTKPYRDIVTVTSSTRLWDLAKQYYGSGLLWTRISEANDNIDPSKLKVGQKLIIPFRTGGETGNAEGLAYLHKKERVLTDKQTEAFNKLVYDFIPQILPQFTMPNLALAGNSPINITEGNIIIQGSVDDNALAEIKRIKKEFVQEVFNTMQSNKYKSGIRR